MPHIHFIFQKRQSEMRERRLAYEKPPEVWPPKVETAKSAPVEAPDLNYEKWQKVFDTLRSAPKYQGDTQAQKLLEDPKILKMIATMVTIRDDNKVNWLPETAQMFAEKYLDVFLSEPEKIKEMKGQATNSVVEFAKFLDKNIGAITSVMDTEDYSGNKLLPDVDNVLKILKAMRATDEALAAHQHALIDIVNIITKTDVIDEKFVDAFFKPFSKRNDLLPISIRLKEIAKQYTSEKSSRPDHAAGDTINRTEHPDLYTRAQSAMLDEVVLAGRLMLVGPEEGSYERDTDADGSHERDTDDERRTDLIKAKDDSKRELVSLDDQQKKLLVRTDYVKARNSYLQWLSGNDVSPLITDSIAADGRLNIIRLQNALNKVNPKSLNITQLKDAIGINDKSALSVNAATICRERLHARGQETTEVELINATQILLQLGYKEAKDAFPFLEQWMIPDLLSIWDTTPLLQFLEREKIIKNHITSSMSHIVLRSYLGEEPADTLVQNDISGLEIGTMIDISKISEFFLRRDKISPTPEIIDIIAWKPGVGPGERKVDKGRFIFLCRFLLGENDSTNANVQWKNLVGNARANEGEVSIKLEEISSAIEKLQIAPYAKLLLSDLQLDGSGKLTVDDVLLNTISVKVPPDNRKIQRKNFVYLMTFLSGKSNEADTKWNEIAPAVGGVVPDSIEIPEEKLKELLSNVSGFAKGVINNLPRNIRDAGDTIVDPILLNAVSEKSDGKGERRKVKKDHFIQALTFVMIDDGVDARKLSTGIWDSLSVTANGKTEVDVETPALEKALGKVRVTTKAYRYMEQIRNKGIADQSFTTEMRNLTVEGLNTVQKGSKQWWEWMKRMPEYYIGNEIDAQLLSIDDRRRALTTYSTAIETTLAAADGTANPIEKARVQAQTINTAQRAAKSRPTLPNGAIDNVEQGYVTVMASKYVTEQLNTMGWSTLPEKAQMVAFSIAMRHKDGKGIESAQNFIRDFKSASNDIQGLQLITDFVPVLEDRKHKILAHVPPNKIDEIAGKVGDQDKLFFLALNKEQREQLFLQLYLGSADPAIAADTEKFGQLKKLSGESILEGPKNAHGLDLREKAMTALMGRIRRDCPEYDKGGAAMLKPFEKSMLVERWMEDRGKQEAEKPITEALNIVIGGPTLARQALITAFLRQVDTEYLDTNGKKKTITAIEANTIVGQFQTVLQTKAAQAQPAKEQLSGKDVRSNPVERGVRATLETIKDLWDGDMVNKATVVATLLVSLWAIRKAWNEAGNKDAPGWMKLLKAGLIATPLLIVGNAAVKRQTGKDYLGEWFSYMPKEKRNAPLESFRRRSAALDDIRYKYMDSTAGHEALRQLTGRKPEIPICDLIKWRESVAQSPNNGELGTNVYANAAPKDLKISAIRSALPNGTTKDEAYKVAYLAFEALCVDVAVMKNLGGGSLDEKANKGADFIEKRYVAFEGYADRPTEQEQMKKRNMTMLDIIIDIANTPESLDAVKDDPNFTEWLAEKLGWSTQKVKEMFVKVSTQAKIRMMRTGELAPEILEGVWGQVKETSRGVYDWWRVARPKISNDMKVQFDAALRLTADTLDSLGVVVKQSGGAIEWSIGKAADLTNFSLESLQRAYEALQGVGVTGEPIKLIDSIAFSVSGYTMSEWILYGRSKAANGKAVDLMQTPELFNKEFATFLDGIKLVVTGKKDSSDWEKGARESLGITQSINDCTPAERALVMERIKRRVYSRLLDARITNAEHAAQTGDQNTMNHALDYPLPDVDLGKWETLAAVGRAQILEEHYGIPMLALLGSEKTQFIGALRNYIDSQKDGVIKTTLDFGHKIATVPNRDDSLEYLDAINVFINQNMREAEQQFATLSPAERDQKLKDYRSMLETVLTNGVIDMTLRNGKSLGLATDALHPSSHEGVPFLLTVTNAKEFRNFLALKRGAIADPSSTQKYIDKFHTKDGSENLIHGIVKDKNVSKILAGFDVEAVAATSGQQETQRPSDLDELLGSPGKPNDANQRRKIIEALPAKNLKDPERQTLIGRIDAEANALTVKDGASIKDALEILGGTSRGAARTLEDKIFNYTASKNEATIQEIADSISGARKLAGTEAGREHLQHALDRVATQQLKRVVEEMKTAKEDLKTRRAVWEPQLLKLYGMTKESTDRLSDCVAYALEYLLYQGMHSQPDINDNTYFKKFEAYLKEKNLKAPTEKSYHFDTSYRPAYFEYENGSMARMAKSVNSAVGPTYLGNLSSRIKVLEDELSK